MILFPIVFVQCYAQLAWILSFTLQEFLVLLCYWYSYVSYVKNFGFLHQISFVVNCDKACILFRITFINLFGTQFVGDSIAPNEEARVSVCISHERQHIHFSLPSFFHLT